MATSQNGYRANVIGDTAVQTIPGTTRKLRVRKGDEGYLLLHFAAWFDKHIEDIEAGQLDDWGYAERPIRGSSTTLSNHASGTAIDLNAPKHPLGVRNTFTKAQAAAIRQQLKVYEGALRWGGDYKNRADEMHVEIEPGAARVKRVAAKLRKTPTTPGTVPSKPVTDAEPSLHLWSLKYATTGKGMSATTLRDAEQFMATVRSQVPETRANELGWQAAVKRGDWVKASQMFRNQVWNIQRHAGLESDGIPGPKTADYLRRSAGYTILP